jgi:hypothetical protein
VGVFGRRPAEDVDADSRAGTRISHPVPTVGWWKKHGHVALVPDVAGCLDELYSRTLTPGRFLVSTLLVTASQVPDHAPAAVVVHAARRPLREYHGQDVEPTGRVFIDEVADGFAVKCLVGAGRQRLWFTQ